MELDGNDYSVHSWQKVVSLDLPTTILHPYANAQFLAS